MARPNYSYEKRMKELKKQKKKEEKRKKKAERNVPPGHGDAPVSGGEGDAA